MRYRWDPAYPMGRRDMQAYDATMRASDDERNAVADKLSRHYAEGRLDEVEFKNRLDTAMSATTRGDLNGLFDDLPRLPSEPPPPPPRHRRILPWVFVVALVAIAAGATMPFYPMYHVPWLLFAIVGLFLWRRAGGHLPLTTTAPPRRRAAQLGHGPLSGAVCTRTPIHASTPIADPTDDRPATTTPRRSTSPTRHRTDGDPGTAALLGALRRPPRRRARGDRRRAAPSPPPTPGRWSRPRTCPSGCGTSSRAGTPSCSATAPRSGCSGGGTRGRSTRSSTSCGRPSPSWRSRRSPCSRSSRARLFRDPGPPPGPGRAPGGALGLLSRPPGPPRVQCPGPSGRYRRAPEGVRRAGTIDAVPPDAGRWPRRTSPRRSP